VTAKVNPHLHGISGSTRLVGIIGWPVVHSLSPVIHNAAFAALDMDWAYVPLPVPPGRLEDAVRGIAAAGFAGANVTMPHKEATSAVTSSLSEEAARLAAVNTLVIAGGVIVGHNTDTTGFARFLAEDVGFDPSGRSALVYGAGGAARACAWALVRGGLDSLTVAVRDRSRAGRLVAAIGEGALEIRVVRMEDVESIRPDLVVNATPLGTTGERLPLPAIGRGTVVVDLNYLPAVTPLLDAARAEGAQAFGGLGLLLHQAVLSFELWTGLLPPMGAMSAAALEGLAESPNSPTP
jgi:shikimate dehydrogenase